jgi:hypothetical protein
MVEDIERHRRELYRAKIEAFEEYQIFLETTPVPHGGSSAAEYLAEMTALQTRLKRAEAARKLFDDYLLRREEYRLSKSSIAAARHARPIASNPE